MGTNGPPPVIGMQEIAELFDMKLGTVHVWRGRKQLPEPDWVISSTPVWKPSTIKAWARKTGRLDDNGQLAHGKVGRKPKADA